MNDRTPGPIRKRPSQPAFDPSAVKVWVKFDLDGTVNASQNVSSISDTGTGDWTVNLTTPFSSADYTMTAYWRDDTFAAGNHDMVLTGSSQLAGSFQILMFDISAAILADPAEAADDIHAAAFGDQ